MIKEINDNLTSGKTSVKEIIANCIDNADASKYLNSYIYSNRYQIMKDAASEDDSIKANGTKPLSGVTISIKDNICTQTMPTTCASNMLRGFRPSFNAVAVEKLLSNGAIITGKANMDEFAMGSSNITSAFGRTRNPYDNKRVSGGSSGGSAVSVAVGSCLASLGTDTGGSVRVPASFCGVVGLKPTYGRVSRTGVFPLATSLDQIGIFTKKVIDNAKILQIISGYDNEDVTSSNKRAFREYKYDSTKKYKIALLKESFDDAVEDDVQIVTKRTADMLQAEGHSISVVSFPYSKEVAPAYSILCSAEATYNLSRFDGVKYGNAIPRLRDEDDIKSLLRGEYFGSEVKTRLLFGKFVTSCENFTEYYLKACKVRTVINQYINELLATYDVVMSPTAPFTAPLVQNIANQELEKASDFFATLANFSGLPAISVPSGMDSNNMPIGIQFMGRRFAENDIFNIANTVEINTNGEFIANFKY